MLQFGKHGLGNVILNVLVTRQAQDFTGMSTEQCSGDQHVGVANDPYATEDKAAEYGASLASLEEVYRRSDYITIHVPLTDQTRGMIGAEQLCSMKPGVRIINCARGGLVDESALADAIRTGHVGGAAFDVFSTEPAAPDNPLVPLPEMVVTPLFGCAIKYMHHSCATR